LEDVCRQIEEVGYQFDIIIGISTGGLLPTRIIANRLGIRNVDVISVNSYGPDKQRGEVRLLVDKNFEHLRGQDILIVDDLVDHGETMKYVISVIEEYNPSLVKTAVIYKKNQSLFKPDFYGQEAEHDQWITFSWEV
jgi:hypothetical protein